MDGALGELRRRIAVVAGALGEMDWVLLEVGRGEAEVGGLRGVLFHDVERVGCINVELRGGDDELDDAAWRLGARALRLGGGAAG